MLRREFIAVLGGAATWPLAARAQKRGSVPRVGVLWSGLVEEHGQYFIALQQGLDALGYVDGQTIRLEHRFAHNQPDRFASLADELVGLKVEVLIAATSLSAMAAHFAAGGNVVALGLVASLSRPGGNVTGATSLNSDIAAKRLGLIRQVVPQEARYFALVNPTSVLADPFIEDLQAGAASLGLHAEILNASTDAEIDAAFAKLPQQPGTVLLVSTDAFYWSRHRQIVTRAERRALPAMFDNREYAVVGGLMSYGADFDTVLQLAGVYTGRILKGEKPADLPVMQSAKYEFVINLKTAKALGLDVPAQLLALADEVIE